MQSFTACMPLLVVIAVSNISFISCWYFAVGHTECWICGTVHCVKFALWQTLWDKHFFKITPWNGECFYPLLLWDGKTCKITYGNISYLALTRVTTFLKHIEILWNLTAVWKMSGKLSIANLNFGATLVFSALFWLFIAISERFLCLLSLLKTFFSDVYTGWAKIVEPDSWP